MEGGEVGVLGMSTGGSDKEKGKGEVKVLGMSLGGGDRGREEGRGKRQ